MTLKLRPYDLHWLEEPIFPPEDFAALARLRASTGVAIAAGENNCTAFQFRDMFAGWKAVASRPGSNATARSPSGHAGAGGGAASSMRISRKTRTAR